MKRVWTVAALALACCPAAGLATDWRMATLSDGAIGYVDADSVRRDGDRIVFEITILLFETPMRRSLARYEGDCAAMTARPAQLIVYQLDGTGRAVPMDAERVRRAEPGTNLHGALSAACTRRYAGPTIPDVEAHAAAAARRQMPKE